MLWRTSTRLALAEAAFRIPLLRTGSARFRVRSAVAGLSGPPNLISRPQHTLYAMNVAYLRRKAADPPTVHVHFHYVNAEQRIDRVFNLERTLAEPVSACLQRIQSNVRKETEKLRRKQAHQAKKAKDASAIAASNAALAVSADDIAVDLLDGDDRSLADRTLDALLADRPAGPLAGVRLLVAGSAFAVAYNLPWVECIALPKTIMAGYFVYPSTLDVTGCPVAEAQFTWLVNDPNAADDWLPVGDSFQWQVPVELIGRRLKVRCTPRTAAGLAGPAVETLAPNAIRSSPPGECLFEQRHRHIAERPALDADAGAFRIVSYNLLADLYADSDYSRAELFPYIPPDALHIDYRRALFIRELTGYQADVICLQEVDAKVFDYDLCPVLGDRRYAGHFQRKGTTAEGVATFYRSDRFELIESTGSNVGDALAELDCMRDIWTAVQTNAALAERIRVRSTAVQVTLLRSRAQPAKVLCVANTHLYFHPDADHIRVLQAAVGWRFAQMVRERFLAAGDGQQRPEDVSMVFCGDFNSTPECGVHRLMTQGCVPRDFVDFRSNADETIDCCELSQPFRMQSAYESIRYTNFTVAFAECIDYIFYQTDDLRCLGTVPPPSDEQLRAHTAIPSVLHPSDHVALIGEFAFRSLE